MGSVGAVCVMDTGGGAESAVDGAGAPAVAPSCFSLNFREVTRNQTPAMSSARATSDTITMPAIIPPDIFLGLLSLGWATLSCAKAWLENVNLVTMVAPEGDLI